MRNRKPHRRFVGIRWHPKHRRHRPCGSLSGVRAANDKGSSLPFADQSFDRAFSLLVLQFVPDAEKAVREMRRVVRSGGTVAAAVWDCVGGMPAQRLFWDAAANLGIASDEELRDFYFRPMTRPNEMRAAWTEAGLKRVEHLSTTIRMEYASFSDYWLPIEAGEAALGKFAVSLAAEQRAALEQAVRKVYLGGEPDGRDPSPPPPGSARGSPDRRARVPTCVRVSFNRPPSTPAAR